MCVASFGVVCECVRGGSDQNRCASCVCRRRRDRNTAGSSCLLLACLLACLLVCDGWKPNEKYHSQQAQSSSAAVVVENARRPTQSRIPIRSRHKSLTIIKLMPIPKPCNFRHHQGRNPTQSVQHCSHRHFASHKKHKTHH